MCSNAVTKYIEIGKLQTMVNVSVILKVTLGAKKCLRKVCVFPKFLLSKIKEKDEYPF